MSRQETSRLQESNSTNATNGNNGNNGNKMREFIPIVGSSSLAALRSIASLPQQQQQQRRATTSAGTRRNSRRKKDQFLTDLLTSSLKQKDRDVNGMCRGRPKGVAVALNSKLTGKGRRQQVVNIHQLPSTLPGVALSRSR
jgi:hypothetical protein